MHSSGTSCSVFLHGKYMELVYIWFPNLLQESLETLSMEWLESQIAEWLESQIALQNGQDSSRNGRPNNEQKMAMHPTEVEDLPQAILADIFLRLPVKSILRAKSACKLWYGIISDYRFTEMHRDRAITNPGYVYKLHRPSRSWADPEILYFAEDDVGGQVEVTKFCSERLDRFRDFRCFTAGFASSGGLVVLFPREEDCYYVWNPITGEKAQVPLPDLGLPDFRLIWWGFGFSSSTKEYKIVHLCFPFSEYEYKSGEEIPQIANQGQGAIYTLGTMNWKRLHHNVPLMPYWSEYVDCNGTLFWQIASDSRPGQDEHQDRTIVSFDILSEEFRVWRVPLLTEETATGFIDYSLIRMGDTVGYLCWDIRGQMVRSIWSLRDKVKEVWIKEYTFAVGRTPNFGFLRTDNLYILMDSDKITYSAYDVGTKEYEHTTTSSPTGDKKVLQRFFRHAASLISPKKIWQNNSEWDFFF